MAIKSMSLRIDDKMLNKLHYVADYEGRSANSQILILIRDCIGHVGEKHGKIQQGESNDENSGNALHYRSFLRQNFFFLQIMMLTTTVTTLTSTTTG